MREDHISIAEGMWELLENLNVDGVSTEVSINCVDAILRDSLKSSFNFGIRPSSTYKKDVTEAASGSLCCVCSLFRLISWL